MIQANDLRIGNLISIVSDPLKYNDYHEVTGLRKDEIEIHNGEVSVTEYFPIPLTSEVLERAGFEVFKASPPYSSLTWMRNKNSVCFGSAGPNAPYGGFTFQSLGGISFSSGSRVEFAYVHDLQNLYHSLTGTELTLNLCTATTQNGDL